MPQADKIAIHVPHQYLSEAVQKYLIEEKGLEKLVDIVCASEWSRRPHILIPQDDNIIEATGASKEWLQGKGYTILTVDEFFKQEAEKKVLVNGTPVSFTNLGFTIHIRGADVDRDTWVSWQEYDEIGKLRPKEVYTDATKSVPHTNSVILNLDGRAEICFDGLYMMKVEGGKVYFKPIEGEGKP